MGVKEAIKRIRRGEDVLANSHRQARELAKKASEGKKPIRDPAHRDGYSPHYHPNPRTGSHILYQVAASVTVAGNVSCDDCIAAELAPIIDFFNPLAAPNDILELIDTFQ